MNAYSSAASAYREASLESAPPLKVVHMMYEGAIKFLGQAQELEPGDPNFGRLLNRADAIVSELQLSLDPEQAPELAGKLTSLYLFVANQIMEALLERTAEPIPAAREVLQTLLDGWKKLEVDLGVSE